jgi:hypothetical protein
MHRLWQCPDHHRQGRPAYARGPDRRPILEMLMVSIDISDVSFT